MVNKDNNILIISNFFKNKPKLRNATHIKWEPWDQIYSDNINKYDTIILDFEEIYPYTAVKPTGNSVIKDTEGNVIASKSLEPNKILTFINKIYDFINSKNKTLVIFIGIRQDFEIDYELSIDGLKKITGDKPKSAILETAKERFPEYIEEFKAILNSSDNRNNNIKKCIDFYFNHKDIAFYLELNLIELLLMHRLGVNLEGIISNESDIIDSRYKTILQKNPSYLWSVTEKQNEDISIIEPYSTQLNCNDKVIAGHLKYNDNNILFFPIISEDKEKMIKLAIEHIKELPKKIKASKKNQKDIETIDIPKELKWDQIKIEFVTPYKIEFIYTDIRDRKTPNKRVLKKYDSIGFCDSRRDLPDSQWATLAYFAMNDGYMRLRQDFVHSKMYKRIQAINRLLKQICQRDKKYPNPIRAKEKVYECKIKISNPHKFNLIKELNVAMPEIFWELKIDGLLRKSKLKDEDKE